MFLNALAGAIDAAHPKSLDRHARRREKVFGPGRRIPLDRNAKARIMMRARGVPAPHENGSESPGQAVRRGS